MTLREEVRRLNEKSLWDGRRALAKRSAVDAPVVAFDLLRKNVRKLRDQDEQDRWWRHVAAVINQLGAEVHDAASCSHPAGSCEVHSPQPGFGPDLDPDARPRARESTDGHTPSAREEQK